MTNEGYRQSICESKRKLDELKTQRDQLDVEMGKLRLLIFATANMLPEGERDEAMEGVSEETLARRVGLTDAIRSALEEAGDWQSPKQIRDSLERSGYDLAEYGNVMASVHMVLKRLAAARQAERKDSAVGGYIYKWIERPAPNADEFMKAFGESFVEGLKTNRKPLTAAQKVILKHRKWAAQQAANAIDPGKLPLDIAAVIGKADKK